MPAVRPGGSWSWVRVLSFFVQLAVPFFVLPSSSSSSSSALAFSSASSFAIGVSVLFCCSGRFYWLQRVVPQSTDHQAWASSFSSSSLQSPCPHSSGELLVELVSERTTWLVVAKACHWTAARTHLCHPHRWSAWFCITFGFANPSFGHFPVCVLQSSSSTVAFAV